MKLSGKYFKFAAYLALVILINAAGLTLFARADLTENKMYSISDISKEVVSTLSEPLTINIFFTKNLPAPYNSVERYLRDLLEEYSIHSSRYFSYQFYDVSPESESPEEGANENRRLAESYGIQPVQIQSIEKDQVQFKKAYMGMVILHGDMMERIPTITSTNGLEYKLTMAIKKLNNKISALVGLKEKVKVALYLSSSLKLVSPYMGIDQIPSLPREIEETVKKLNAKVFDKLEFSYTDPATDEEKGRVSAQYNLLRLKWPELQNGGIPAGDGVIGLVMEHGGRALNIPLLNVIRHPLIGTQYELADINGMEQMLNDSMELLIDINDDIGYISDHGALTLFPKPSQEPGPEMESASVFQRLVSQNYSIKEIELKKGKIAESVNSIIIAGVKEKFSDYELFQIDQALMRGKSLAIFIDKFQEIKPQQRGAGGYQNRSTIFVPNDTGLEKLLEHYGISIRKSYVMDEKAFRQIIPPQFGGGDMLIPFAPVVKNKQINNEPGFMQNIRELITMKVSPLEINKKRLTDNGIKSSLLFSSSEKSWEVSKNITLNPPLIKPPASEDDRKSVPLAYLLEGEFPSYFAGKPVPEKPLEKTEEEKADENEKGKTPDMSKIEGEGAVISRGMPAKIFLISTSSILKNNMLDEAGQTPNATFLINLLDALNDREGIAVMRSKKQSFNPLDELSPGSKTMVKYLNIIGLPTLATLLGLAVWMRRAARRKRILRTFQPEKGSI